MDHGPAVEHEVDYASEYKTRIGLVLFAIYGALFLGFVLTNALFPQAMEIIVFMGLNLAVFYGFMLIIMAIVMGLIYNALCTAKENQLEKERATGSDSSSGSSESTTKEGEIES